MKAGISIFRRKRDYSGLQLVHISEEFDFIVISFPVDLFKPALCPWLDFFHFLP
jgi:hypothetical protein